MQTLKIGITGNTGFIGSKVQAKLIELGYETLGFDITDGQSLLDLEMVETFVKECDVVYHIAASADLTKIKSVDDGKECIANNVLGTDNIAYACAKYNKWLIYASTVCVYGNQEHHPEMEDVTLPNPSELYACSKYAGEWIVKGYSLNFGNPYTILRFATIYGEGMRPALGMHIFFRQALKGEPITVHGDGMQDRTLTYIHDLVEGIVAPLAHATEAKNEVFNLTAPTPVSALKMAQDIQKVTATTSEIQLIPQRSNQTYHEDFDVSKAKALLDWEARTSWQDGLNKTMTWMKTQI